ncbi:MAG: hypothetical protein JWN17_2884 [Frankiales bacterium]|nr:hypothetical protein [Frankiales bacterium]
MPLPPARWGLVVPVKHLPLAKTRLRPYDDDVRRALALAMACDVVVAAAACPLVVGVLVVTSDADAARALARLGARTAPDDPDDGLNAALEHGAELLRADDADLGVAALAADLPALRPGDLAAALGALGTGRGVVADHLGTGTTLLAAAPGSVLRAGYGPGSFSRHLSGGAVDLPAAAGLRLDVDTPEDLAAALRLGVGPRTAAVAAGLP